MIKHMSENVRVPVEESNPAIKRDEDSCILCGKCRRICMNFVGVHGTYELMDNNDNAICIGCGQCTTVCPADSLTEKYEYPAVRQAVNNTEKIVVVSISPSMRVSFGEAFGMPAGSFVQEQTIGLLRELGVDYVLDTNFAADLVAVESAAELTKRFLEGSDQPLFSATCPSWVKYVEIYHPELIPNLSTCKSPIAMQGATVKTYFAQKMGLLPDNIVHVCLTACTAKKMEARRPELNAAGRMLGKENMRDIDYVITARELAKWAEEEGIVFDSVQPSSFDRYMGQSSGGGVIFGNSGGMLEATIRTAYQMITKTPPPEKLYRFEEIRGYEDVKAASVEIEGKRLNVAALYGTANADKFLKYLSQSPITYHFIEVMTCPGGCIGGGGQPKGLAANMQEVHEARMQSLYNRDKKMNVKASQENPQIQDAYRDFFGKAGSEKAQTLLHTSYKAESVHLLPRNEWLHLKSKS